MTPKVLAFVAKHCDRRGRKLVCNLIDDIWVFMQIHSIAAQTVENVRGLFSIGVPCNPQVLIFNPGSVDFWLKLLFVEPRTAREWHLSHIYEFLHPVRHKEGH